MFNQIAANHPLTNKPELSRKQTIQLNIKGIEYRGYFSGNYRMQPVTDN
jgi:hypothetical protein